MNGCTAVTSYTLVDPVPLSSQVSTPDEPNCFGGTTCISVDSASGGSGQGYTFTINRGNRFPLDTCIEVFAGAYTVTVFDSEGCSEDHLIDIGQPAQLTVDLGEDISVPIGLASDPVAANINTNFDIDSIVWTPMEDLECMTLDCQVVAFQPLNTTSYTVRIIDENGCVATDDIVVNINKRRNVYFANIFSPNNDNVNDRFQVAVGSGIEAVELFAIYDRWGNRVFLQEDFLPSINDGTGWDGTFKSNNVPSGVYPYIATIRYIDGQTENYKGSITLIR